MENAVEALKYAFAVMMFVMALSLSISSFSSAREAVESITQLRDRETEYTYVNPTNDLTRTVGIETVIPSMYRAYEENIEIYFLDERSGTTKPFVLYYKINNDGDRIIENGNYIGINYINLELENFASLEEAMKHLDILLSDSTTYDGEYKNQICDENKQGLYNVLSQYKFKESFGEYYQGTGATKIKKRVITYTITETV